MIAHDKPSVYHQGMLNVTLNDKTAKLLESHRRTERLSREKALDKLFKEARNAKPCNKH
jgi:hypothetical protein